MDPKASRVFSSRLVIALVPIISICPLVAFAGDNEGSIGITRIGSTKVEWTRNGIQQG